MIHPDTCLQFISQQIGYGVCAAKLIRKGTIIWVQDSMDLVFTEEQYHLLHTLQKTAIDHYAFVNSAGNYVLCWDAARYVNHSCAPTTVSIGNFCTIAARDLQVGEQLTEDYSTLNILSELNCACSSPNCRQKVSARDIAAVSAELDKKALAAVQQFAEVEQPLLCLLTEQKRVLLENLAKGHAELPSCYENHWTGVAFSGFVGSTKPTDSGLWARSK